MGPAPANFLDRIDREPAETRLKLVRDIMAAHPLAFFKELRAKRPVMVLPECTLIALYDDVIEMLNMPKVFTVALYEPKMANGYLMSHDDDALHYREKSLMQGLLNRDDLPKVRSMVGDICRDILSNAKGSIDAVGGYCRLAPATIVRDYFGLIGMHRKDLMEWSYWAQVDTFYNQPFDIATSEERKHITDMHNRTSEKLGKYIAALILTRAVAQKFAFLTAPVKKLWRKLTRQDDKTFHDDIVTRMLRTKFPSEVDFDIKRVGVNAGGLLIGTIETTAQSTVQTIEYLIKRPELLSQAINAARLDDPTTFDGIVWEALRFVPISPYMFRQTASEYTIAKGTNRETTIPPRTNVLALTQSAMFDEKAFDDPEEFRAGRNWYHYFTFGYGAHECLGKYVGMVMIPEIVRQILLQPGLQASGSIVYDGHMPKSYELTWSA
ncbi:MAG TPA: cytochrome P450 [Bryobacteraceae bacterium]|nr:cytochrome P450 [Bryobacteraceae bacterium]